MAIISRLEDGKRVAGMPRASLLDKLEMFDGKFLPPWTRADVIALQDEGDREGMFGLSPRYIINRLADSMGQEQECLRPLDALEALVEGLEERAGLSNEERERLPNLLPEVIKGYKNMALRQVQQAAFEGFADLAQGQFEAYINDAKNLFDAQENPIPGHRVNDHLMRRVEGALNMRESERTVFRQEVFRTHESMVRDGHIPSYQDFPLLQQAIDKLLFPNPRELEQTLDPKQTNHDRLQHRKETVARLQSDHGYCKKCAKDLIQVAFRAIQNRDVASIKRGRLVHQ
jgi:serine protein kinase